MASTKHYLSATWCALAFLAVSAAQAGEHRGLVKFAGLPMPGASITLAQGEKKLTAITGPDGDYSFPDVADGVWQIQVEMLCFEPISREVAVAATALPAQWELKMLSLDAMQAVTAAPSAAPAAAPVTTSAASPETPAPRPAAPAKGRGNNRPTTTNRAAATAPPANQAGFQRTDVNESRDAGRIQAQDPAVTASEANTSNSSLLVNGSMNNGASSPFAQSQAFGNMRKGPGWRYNGAIAMQVDNSALNARNYSLTGQPTPQPAFNHMRGTASFGGPFFIPKLLPLRRTSPNFFFSYNWQRDRNASTQTSRMPTDAERAGDFTNSFTPLGQPAVAIDPTTGQPFPGNVIPANRISTQAGYLLRLYPRPNFNSDPRYNYQVPLVGTQSADGVQFRMNKNINPRNPVNGSFSWQRSRGVSPNIFAFRDTNATRGWNLSLNWMHRFSQRVFTNTRVEYSRQSSRLTPYFAGVENISGNAGITGNNQEPLNWGPPSLAFASGIASLGDAQQSLTRNQTASISSSTNWNYRSHNMTFGGDYRRQQFNQLSQQDPRGTFNFTSPGAAGYDFAGFLLGIPDTSSIAFGNADKYFRAKIYDLFFNDDWRMRTGFTLNYGLRWEYNTPIVEKYGRLVNLDIAPGFTKAAPVVANQPTGPVTGQNYRDSLVNPTRNAIEPRVGFAWHPILGSSMVVRGGYGIYYDTSLFLSIATRMAQQAPLSKSLIVSNSKEAPLTLANGFYTPPNVLTNNFAIDPNFRVGRSQNFYVSVQRDLPFALVMSVQYMGNRGGRAQQQSLPNTYPGTQNPCPSCPSGFYYLSSNGSSSRNAGIVQVRRRMHNGFTASVQYTFAKALDNAALGAQGQAGALTAQNWLDLGAERGRSNFDQRHVFNITGQYTTGMGMRGGALLSGWRGAAFKKWTIVTQITSATGRPLTPIYPSATGGSGVTGSIRPNYTGLPVYDGPGGLAFNRAAFAEPAAGQWGNAGRNSLTGPGQFTLNGSMQRSFGEGKVDFRLDASNALNHPVFGAWNANIQSAQFGLPTSPGAMRVIQANLRVRIP